MDKYPNRLSPLMAARERERTKELARYAMIVLKNIHTKIRHSGDISGLGRSASSPRYSTKPRHEVSLVLICDDDGLLQIMEYLRGQDPERVERMNKLPPGIVDGVLEEDGD